MRSLSNYNFVYFCSAYNDLSHIIAFIEREMQGRHLIVVVNIHQCFTFVKTLSIDNTDVIFIQSKLRKPKYPVQWILEWRNLKEIKTSFLNGIVGAKVVFFTSFYDLVTSFCVNYLKKKNDIYLGIPVDNLFKKSNKRIIDIMYSFLYGIKFDTFILFNKKVTGLPISYLNQYVKQDLQVGEKEIVAARKKYSKQVIKGDYFLFLDANINYEGLIDAGQDTVNELFNLLKKFNIVIKGHPRLGPSSFTVRNSFLQIESLIPIEFIDFSKCLSVIGGWSIALANIANMGVKSISLLKLLPYADEKLRQSRINYLEQYSPSKILYPTTLDDLEKELVASFQ